MKKLLGLLFALLLCAALLPALAGAETWGVCGENLTWTFDASGTLTISGTGAMTDYSTYPSPPYIKGNTIKRVVIGDGVTHIGEYAFMNCGDLISVSIGKAVETIGKSAFYMCSSLTEAELPASLTEIGEYAFSNCMLMTRADLPSGLVRIGEHAFDCCTKLASVVIPASVTAVGNRAFDGCHAITEIAIPGTVTELGEYAFSNCHALVTATVGEGIQALPEGLFCNCEALEALSLPTTLKTIGDYAFHVGFYNQTYPLKSVRIPDGVTHIGNCAFQDRGGLESVALPASLTALGSNAFTYCFSLTEIALPDGVQTVGASAFSNCAGLQRVTLPISVASIGDSAFVGCAGLQEVFYGGTQAERDEQLTIGTDNACLTDAQWHYVEPAPAIVDSGACENNLTWTLDEEGTLTIRGTGEMWGYGITYVNGSYITSAPWGKHAANLKAVVIESGVTTIGNSAFYGCISLTSVSIPEGVTTIGSSAFRDCSGLTSVSIPEGVTTIGDWAFYNCISLTSVSIPEGVTTIGYQTFYNCSSLTSVSLPEGVTTIGNSAFYDCSGLTSVSLPEGVTTIGSFAFSGCSSLTGVSLPEGVTTIGGSAFSGCSSLTSVSLPEGVTTIGSHTFNGCSHLTSVSLPEGVTTIGDYAFYNCSHLTSVSLPEGVTTIGYEAFRDCSSLTSVSLPEGVTTIGSDAFYGCSSLTSVSIPEGVTSIGDSAFYNCSSLTSVSIPEGVTTIGGAAFSGCSSLTGVSIPEGVTTIDSAAFYDCSNLTSVSIPESVTTIGSYAFYNCSGLANVSIPEGVTSIGDYAFRYCSSLTSVSIPEGVTIISSGAFYDCSSLTSVSIPESVTTIGNSAFCYCSGLTSVSIPEDVTTIGSDAFNYCYKLKKVFFAVQDMGLSISFGYNIFDSIPTVYCYMFTALDIWCTNNGITPIYLDETDINAIRTVTLPEDFRLACGDAKRLNCIVFPTDNAPIAWTSSDPAVLTVDDGTVTALTPGTATVTATVGSVSDSVTIETYVPATGLTLSHGECWLQAKQGIALLVASYVPENASANITWSSSDTSLATVDATGNVTTIKPGDVTITATTEKGVTADCVLHLTYPVSSVTLEPESAELFIDETLQLTATANTSKGSYTNKLVSFAASDETIATVDGDGLVTAVHPGVVTITATASNNISASVEITVKCAEHIPVVDAAIAPTCTETGLTEGQHCDACGEILVQQEVVDALGHEWGEVGYVWSEDNAEVTATRVCARDEAHVETETVAATGALTREPTCEDMGETTYTSWAFENAAFAVQSRTLTDVAALGHDWDAVSYVWSGDYSQVTATRVCKNDSEHKQTETVAATGTVTKPATCEAKGETTYTSDAFENTAFAIQTETIDNVDALDHTPETDPAVPATCTATGLTEGSHCEVCHKVLVERQVVAKLPHSYVTDPAVPATCEQTGLTAGFHCGSCGEVFVAQEEVAALGHAWGEAAYAWADDNATVTATRTCSHDASHVETETVPASRALAKAPTETESGEILCAATFESPAFTPQQKTVPEIPALKDMKVLRLPASLTNLEAEAFMGLDCQAVIIPEGCASIGARAFADCKNLLYVKIPASVRTVADDAFEGCPAPWLDRIE